MLWESGKASDLQMYVLDGSKYTDSDGNVHILPTGDVEITRLTILLRIDKRGVEAAYWSDYDAQKYCRGTDLKGMFNDYFERRSSKSYTSWESTREKYLNTYFQD